MLKDIIHYNHSANLAVIDVFSQAGKSIPEAERLFSHILNAQTIWLSRINNTPVSMDTFQLQDRKDFRSLEDSGYKELLRVLNETTLSEEIFYKTMKGDQFSNTVSDILFHLVNHSTYHRGQIASIFRKADVQPAVTDFIVYKRDGRL